jgi:hypothetical protein
MRYPIKIAGLAMFFAAAQLFATDPNAEKGDVLFRVLQTFGFNAEHTGIYWYCENVDAQSPCPPCRSWVIQAVGPGYQSGIYPFESSMPGKMDFLFGQTYQGAFSQPGTTLIQRREIIYQGLSNLLNKEYGFFLWKNLYPPVPQVNTIGVSTPMVAHSAAFVFPRLATIFWPLTYPFQEMSAISPWGGPQCVSLTALPYIGGFLGDMGVPALITLTASSTEESLRCDGFAELSHELVAIPYDRPWDTDQGFMLQFDYPSPLYYPDMVKLGIKEGPVNFAVYQGF